MRRVFYFAVIAVVAVLIVRSIFIPVDETQYAVIIRLGDPVRVIDRPGLALKYPSPFETVTLLDKRLMVFDPPGSEFLTEDKKNMVADAYLVWRISDPRRFIRTVGDRTGAEARLQDILSSELGVSLGRQPLSSLVSVHPAEVKIPEMMRGVRDRCDSVAGREYGIKVVDARLKRINFPEQNRASVFDRMAAERERIAKKYRAEGEEEASKIAAETTKKEKAIMSEAQMRSQMLRGEGEAEATKIFAEAYREDPEFYRLLRTLEAYRRFMDAKTTVVLSSDSKLLKLLTEGDGKEARK